VKVLTRYSRSRRLGEGQGRHREDFGIFPDDAKSQFFDEGLKSIPKMFRMGKWEFAKWSYLMLKTRTCHLRSEKKYSKLNAAQMWRPLLKDTAYRTWRSCFMINIVWLNKYRGVHSETGWIYIINSFNWIPAPGSSEGQASPE
jgi:hypothetical protein